MRNLLLLLSFISFSSYGQLEIDTLKTIQACKAFKLEQDRHYLDKKESPLLKKERRKFKGHSFYPINMSYCVIAQFERILLGDTIIMITSSNTQKVYTEYALLKFELEGIACELMVYQNVKLSKMKEYKDYLFVPFKDLTSGKDSYGGGRYFDIKIPEGDEVILNFNMAYIYKCDKCKYTWKDTNPTDCSKCQSEDFHILKEAGSNWKNFLIFL